jgi:hypothetical protein
MPFAEQPPLQMVLDRVTHAMEKLKQTERNGGVRQRVGLPTWKFQLVFGQLLQREKCHQQNRRGCTVDQGAIDRGAP